MTNSRGYGGGGGRGKGGRMGRGMGCGGGGGRGRRRGMGQGRGAGRGIGRGREFIPTADGAPFLKAHDADERESQAIKAQAQDMTAHLRAFNKRIAEIEGAGPVQSVSTGGQQSYLPDREWDFMRMTAIVDKERCSCCRFCMDICPELAITMNDTAVIDPYKCTACGSCIDECPTEAISLSRMKKRTAS